MPKSCNKCPLKSQLFDAQYICTVNHKRFCIDAQDKPDWYPIQELPENITKRIGSNILFLLHNSNITCEELIEKSNYSYKDLCRIFSGELMLTPIELQKIADIFGVTKHDLINSCIDYKN